MSTTTKPEAPEVIRPGMTLVAGWPMFSPTPKPDLTDDLWAALLMIQAADEVENDDIIAFIARAEAHMGTTDMHRIDAKEAAGLFTAAEADDARRVIRARISAEKRRQMLDQSRHAASLDAPTRDPATVIEIARLESKLRDAEAEAASLRAIDAKKHRKEIRRLDNVARGHAEKMAEVRAQEAEQYRLYGAARDAVIRAKARGECIQAADVETAEFVTHKKYGGRILRHGLPVIKYSWSTRVRKLTGIQHAHANGFLGENDGQADRRYGTGSLYGECYETVRGMTSNSAEGGGGGGYGPKGPQPRLIEDGQDFRDLRANITERQRTILDLVCGQGHRLGQAADIMGSDDRTARRRLCSALDDAGRSLATERAKRAGKLVEAA